MSNPYDMLGVKKDASTEEIKRAFRKKAKKHHPDRAGGDTDVMAEVNEAYALLTDDIKRKKFDNEGTTDRVPTIEERAMQSLAKAFDDMLAEEAPAGNVVTMIDRAIMNAIARYEVDIKKIESYVAKLDKKATIVNKKDNGGVNLWENVVASRRQRYALALAANQEALAIARLSKDLLAEYVCTLKEPEAPKVTRYPASTSLFDDWTVT
jgi:curved DNA-binding protein CbpA